MNIHLIFAMQAEAEHIIRAFNLKKLNIEKDFDVYQGEQESKTIRLFVNQKDADGMDKLGTMQVGLLTYKAIQFQKPDLIISMGTCGGIYDHGVRLLDVICADRFLIYHDRFTGDNELSIKQSLRFSPCISLVKLLEEHEFKHGVIASSNSLVPSSNSWNLIRKYKVQCVDMEGAAVAEVAFDYKIPFVALKVVTDNVYEVNPIDAFSQFEENFHPAMEHLAVKFQEVFPYMDSLSYPR